MTVKEGIQKIENLSQEFSKSSEQTYEELLEEMEERAHCALEIRHEESHE